MTQVLPHCERCGSAIEAGDLRCPVCYRAVLQASGDREPSIRIHVLRCSSCGAAMEYRARVQSPQCAFCASVLKIEQQTDPMEQTEQYLPFTVDRQTALAVYRRWLSRQGFFRPSNLASAARLESLRALWWVGWAVDAKAVVTWTVDSNDGARRASWAPHAGELETVFDGIVIPATRGLSPVECAKLIPTYVLTSGVQPLETEGISAVRERFATSRSVARGRIVEVIARMAEGRIKGRGAPGIRFCNFHAAIHLRGLVTRRIAFPAYAIAYRYGGRLYRSVISGQDSACIVGQLPHSLAKLAVVIVLICAGLVAMGLIVGSGLLR